MAVDGLVGEAWILVRPYTQEFAPTLKKEVGAATAAVDTEMAAAGGLIGAKTMRKTEQEAENAAQAVATKFRKKMDSVGHRAVSSGAAAALGGLAIAEAGKQVVEAATSFETAEASIASQTGQTLGQVKALGKEFLNSARNGEIMFKASDLASAYAGVAGQLKLTTGHVATNTQALTFMKAAEDAAEASGGELGSTTNALSSTMQAFHLKIKDVNAEADMLYNISRALNTPIDAVSTVVDRLHTRLGIAAPSLSDTGALMVSFGKAGVQGQRGLMIVNSALSTLLGTAKAGTPAAKASQASIQSARIAEQVATDNVTKALKTYGSQSEQYVIAVERQRLAQKKLADLQSPTQGKMTATQKVVQDLGLKIYDQHGKFVGMSNLIEQLAPKLDKMSEKTRTAALQTLFGKSAAQLMASVIMQGVPGWDKATAAVDRQGTAARGARLQAHTLSGEWRTLTSQENAISVVIGQKVIPVLTKATGWLVHHKTAAEALAGVIGGILVLAVGRYVGTLLWSTVTTGKQIAKQIGQWTGLSKKVEETKVAADSTSKSIGKAGTKAGTELETAGQQASTDIAAGGKAAGTEMAAGGEAADAELAAGGLTTEGELAAGGEAAATEMTAGGETAAAEMAAGGGLGGGAGLLGKAGLGAGAAEGAGLLGVEGLTLGTGVGVAAAGGLAYMTTSQLLHQTPLGTGVTKASVGVEHLFGLGPNTNPDKNLTSEGADYHKALGEAAKQLGETEDQAMHDKRAEAIVRQKMGWTAKPQVKTPAGWHPPMALPTAKNDADLKRLIAEQNGGTKQVASHTNTTNALLKKQNATLDRIDRSLARRTHGHVTQLSRFLAEEFRQ